MVAAAAATARATATSPPSCRIRAWHPFSLLATRVAELTDRVAAEDRTAGLGSGRSARARAPPRRWFLLRKGPEAVQAVVPRGGRPDLAGEHLRRLRQPTLLIVGATTWSSSNSTVRPSSSWPVSPGWRSSTARHTCSRSPARWRRWRAWPGTGSSSACRPQRIASAGRPVDRRLGLARFDQHIPKTGGGHGFLAPTRD